MRKSKGSWQQHKKRTMRKLTLFIIIVFISSYATSQGLYPKGCYMSFKEIITKNPSKQYDLEIKKRTNSDIKMNGGNDYKLISHNHSTKKKTLKKEILAYSTGDTLFINCLPYKLQTWYSKIISDGKYFVFIAGIPMDRVMQRKEMKNGMAFGAIGGAFAGASLAMKRYLYVLDEETNKVTIIDQEVMNHLLEEYPDLREKFDSDSLKNKNSTEMDYLKLLNKYYKADVNSVYKKSVISTTKEEKSP